MGRLLKHWLGSKRATAAIEFALTAPILLLLTGGVIEFGRIFQVYEAVNKLAAQYAIAYADCSDTPAGTCGTELNYYTNVNAIANIVPQLQSPTVQMFQVSMTTSSPYSVSVTYPSGGSLTAAQTAAVQTALTPAAQAALSNNAQSTIYGVLVTVSYTHSLIYFHNLMTPYLGGFLSPAYTVVQLKS